MKINWLTDNLQSTKTCIIYSQFQIYFLNMSVVVTSEGLDVRSHVLIKILNQERKGVMLSSIDPFYFSS